MAQPPVAVFADLPTLAAAPQAMIAAGYGDILGKTIALAHWRLGHLLWNEPYSLEIAARVRAPWMPVLMPQTRLVRFHRMASAS